MTPEQRFQRAQALLIEGQAGAAEAMLIEGAQPEELNAPMSLMLAFACLAQGRRAAARDAFSRAAARDRGQAVPELMLASMASEDGNRKTAEQIYRSLSARFPQDAAVRLAIGAFDTESGDLIGAASHLAAAAALAPELDEPRHNLGIVAARLGLLDRAERLLSGTNSREALGQVLIDQGRMEEAQALAPTLADAARAFDEDDWPNAAEALARQLALGPDAAEMTGQLGAALDASGRASRRVFARAARLGDETARSWMRLFDDAPRDDETPVHIAAMDELGESSATDASGVARIRIEDAAFESEQWHVRRGARLSNDLVLVWPEGPRRLLGPIARDGRALLRRTPAGSRHDAAILWGCSDNFYHWLADDLPRLPGVLAAPAACPVIVNAPLSRFQLESLEHLGFDLDRLAPMTGFGCHTARDLHVPILCGLPRRIDGQIDRDARPVRRETLDWLRRAFDAWRAKSGAMRRLFVSRRSARFRHLVNETEIEALLIDRGFTILEPEHLSLAEQIAIFSGAEIVVGVHGAGLANMIFAPQGAALIELHPPGPLPPYFKAIAAELGMRHRALTGVATRSLHPLKRSFWHFRLDPGQLAEALDAFMR